MSSVVADAVAVADRYTVEHETRYAYRVPVAQSAAHFRHAGAAVAKVLARPRDRATADEGHQRRDAFGNG
jgi:hypothetical protein